MHDERNNVVGPYPRLTSEPGHQWLPIIKSRPRRLGSRRVARAWWWCGKVGEGSVCKVALVAAVLVVVIHHVWSSQLHIHVCLLVVTLRPVLNPMQPREPVLMIWRVRVCAKEQTRLRDAILVERAESREHTHDSSHAGMQSGKRRGEGRLYRPSRVRIYRLRSATRASGWRADQGAFTKNKAEPPLDAAKQGFRLGGINPQLGLLGSGGGGGW